MFRIFSGSSFFLERPTYTNTEMHFSTESRVNQNYIEEICHRDSSKRRPKVAPGLSTGKIELNIEEKARKPSPRQNKSRKHEGAY